MTYAELYNRVEALAQEAEAIGDDDALLVAMVLFVLCGAMCGAGGGVRSLAKLVIQWNDDALRGLDAERN